MPGASDELAPHAPTASSAAPSPTPGVTAAHGPIPALGDGSAARWLQALETLAGHAAHEINNALNGALMNLEVVRLRARPGADAGGVATFAVAAASQAEEAARLMGALLALARAPRNSGGVGESGVTNAELGGIVGDVTTLLAPAVAHRGVTLVADVGTEPVPTGVDARLARLAVTTLLLQTTAPAADADPPQGLSVELAGVHSAGNAAGANREPVRIVRCTLGGGGAPTVQVTGDVLPGMPDGALDAVLRAAGIHRDADALILRFPAPGR